jgi:hypothetical protein
MINIIINEQTNKTLIELWKQHYDEININYKIIENQQDLQYLKELSENDIILTEYDFLFKYEKNQDDIMILNKNIKEEDLKKSNVIGRVFSVPINNKKDYTTFEIPDFILYKHHDHTNYTKDGIKINFNKDNIEKTDISDDIVCFSMRKSEVAFENEYYETNILYKGTEYNNIYIEYANNIFVNKELKYGIIWHAKCASSTIVNYFTKYNNININDSHTLTYKSNKYTWNNYLQNFDMISFIRHPYYRLISAYFNKHIDKLDNNYLNLDTYNKYINLYNQDTINNLALYLKNKNILDEHTLPITGMYYNTYNNLKNIRKYDIDNGVVNILQAFFSKYHNLNELKIDFQNITDKNDIIDLNPNFKYFNYHDWIHYRNIHKKYPNYLSILDNELRDLLYSIYKDDIIKYGDIFINKIHNKSITQLITNNDLDNLNNFLPKDFNVNIYIDLNPDLDNLNEIELKLHYIDHSKSEGRKYKYDKLPNDFQCNMYKELNPDLINLNDVQSKLHYIEYGIYEGRKYNYDISKLPIDFDVHMYRAFNLDIKDYNDSQLISHYIEHGIFEKRQYNDIHFDAQYFSNKYNINSNLYLKYIYDIRQLKNSYFTADVNKYSVNSDYKYIFLFNHDYTLFGANHYMYLLFNILKNTYQNTNIKPLLCEVEYNPQLLPKYSIFQNDVVEYKNDPTLLYMLYEHFNPKLVYLNSCNLTIFYIYKYFPKDITIIHSHEIFEHYLLAKTNVPSFVVSHRIAQEYNTYYKNDNNFVMPSVQPPFLSNIDEILTLSNENIYVISNGFGIIDMNKITIGMCGQITNRKNYQLFIEVSKHYPQYNFLWIGDDNNVFAQYNNIYYITHTNNPYKYYKQILDYFILFSHQDPCPYVILENIVLETKIITFAKNIYTEHKSDLIKDFYFEYPNEINLNNCIDAINIFVNKSFKQPKITSNKGREYIDKYFSFPHQIYQKIENILNN